MSSNGPEMPGGVITGWGIALPDKVVTNDDLSARLDTSDAWIRERTGIVERRIGGTTSGLAIEAGNEALRRAGVEAHDIDLLVLATTTADAIVPGTSATVQDALGTSGGAFDLNAACSGFVYALVAAHGMVLAGAKRVLVIGSETLSRITDWDERGVAILVGDGAGAVVLEATQGRSELLSWDLGANGALRHLLKCDHGGYLYMNGKEIFRHAVHAVVSSSHGRLGPGRPDGRRCRPVRPPPGQCPHHQRRQPAPRNPRRPLRRDHRPLRKHFVGVDPSCALADALQTGRLTPGSVVLLSGFGGGMTWASAVLRWGG